MPISETCLLLCMSTPLSTDLYHIIFLSPQKMTAKAIIGIRYLYSDPCSTDSITCYNYLSLLQ